MPVNKSGILSSLKLGNLYEILKKAPIGPFSTEVEIIPLEGASSHLAYYRVREDGNTVILLETVGEKSSFDSFIHIGNFLRKKGIGVPELYYHDQNQGIALVEDLGDTSLYKEFLDDSRSTHFIPYYKKVLETLAEIQIRGSNGIENCPILKGRIFDHRALRWETDYFKQYFLKEYCNIFIENEGQLDEEFEYLAQSLAQEPLCFMHRDFQSQNIFIKDGEIRIIDFQSAHRGMLHYDLVSLLKDSYIVIPDKIREGLLDYYLDILKQCWKLDLHRGKFKKTFHLAGLQRNMQALGAFSFLSLVKGKNRFKQYIPAGIHHLSSALMDIPGFDNLKGILNSDKVLETQWR